MATGYVRVATVGSVDVRVHWVAPIAWVLSGLSHGRADLGLAGILAAMTVYIAHGAGHWAVARLHRLTVTRIDIDGLGASVQTRGRAPRGVHAQVAFGGVLTHVLLAIVLSGVATSSSFAGKMMWVNLVLGILNMLPFGSLDGAKGWRHFSAVLRSPMRVPGGVSEHPAIRAQQLAAESDRDVGHPRKRTPGASPEEATIDPASVDVSAAEISRQVDSLMASARAEAKARRAARSDDEPG